MSTPIQRALDSLNHAFAIDPFAMRSILCAQVPCARELAYDHPFVQVAVIEGAVCRDGAVHEDSHTLSTMGLLNGAIEAATGECIASMWSKEANARGEYTFLGFCVYAQPKVKPTVKPEEKSEKA